MLTTVARARRQVGEMRNGMVMEAAVTRIRVATATRIAPVFSRRARTVGAVAAVEMLNADSGRPEVTRR